MCCCVQNFVKIGRLFAEIRRYIDFQNGSRPPSWNCFTIIRDNPRSLCCWPQLPVKFHVNLIHRSEDLNFSHIGLKMLIQAPKMGVLRDFGPINVIIHHRDPQKAHPCVNLRLLRPVYSDTTELNSTSSSVELRRHRHPHRRNSTVADDWQYN